MTGKSTSKQPTESKHANFIRSLPCCKCYDMGKAEWAHVRKGTNTGGNQKPHHRHTVPLCGPHWKRDGKGDIFTNGCHQIQHSKGELTFWGDMDYPHALGEKLYKVSGDWEKGVTAVMEFRRENVRL